ncbi:MAG: decaprenyl-phosphate phosphoribosyltransferase [Sumerlaeia bacterium]
MKNVLLFAGLVFALRIDDPHSWLNACLGFAIFSALSGVVYICNDILDREEDRLHPKKRFRPIASGAISPAAAGLGAIILGATALFVSFFFLPIQFAYLALGYLVLVTLYSTTFKHAVILDILILALGFVIRALAGIEVIRYEGAPPVVITPYFLITTLFLALFLAICKRRSEIVTLGEDAGSHRRVLKDYSRELLDMMLMVATSGVVFSYGLWTVQGQFAQTTKAVAPALHSAGNTYYLVLTLPFVLYGIFRYLWLVFQRDEGGAPETLLYTDKPLLLTVILWVMTVVAFMLRLG